MVTVSDQAKPASKDQVKTGYLVYGLGPPVFFAGRATSWPVAAFPPRIWPATSTTGRAPAAWGAALGIGALASLYPASRVANRPNL